MSPSSRHGECREDEGEGYLDSALVDKDCESVGRSRRQLGEHPAGDCDEPRPELQHKKGERSLNR